MNHVVLAIFIFLSSAIFAAPTDCVDTLSLKTRRQLLAEIREGLGDPQRSLHLRDAQMLHFIGEIKAAGAVTLAVGNSTLINRSENLVRYVQLAKDIAASGRFVIYDADASTAPFIRAGAGLKAIGISAVNSNSSRDSFVVQIHNMHMRLSAYGDDVDVIAGTDSLTGVALAIHRKAKFIFDTNGSWNNALAKWVRRLKTENLGLKFSEIPVLHSFQQMQLSPNALSAPLSLRPLSFSRLRKQVLQEVLDHANTIRDVQLQTGKNDGAVIFGSANVDRNSASEVYDVSFALGAHGISGTTGGAGGTMWIVNAGFFDAGSVSVGLPIGGRNQLANETKVHSEVQTLSVETPNYHVRLYELLRGKELVGVAPGGGGTMREVAGTLLVFAPNPQQSLLLGFIKSSYSQELIDLLFELPLPQAFKNRIVRSLTKDNVPQIVERISKMPGVSRSAALSQRREAEPHFSIDRFKGL